MTKDVAYATLAGQKAKLIAEGELYRVGLVHAKVHLAQSLRPQELLHQAVDHAVGFATTRFEQLLAPTGLRLQTAMPYLIAAFSFMVRKKLIKPVLGVLAVAIGVTWLTRRKRR